MAFLDFHCKLFVPSLFTYLFILCILFVGLCWKAAGSKVYFFQRVFSKSNFKKCIFFKEYFRSTLRTLISEVSFPRFWGVFCITKCFCFFVRFGDQKCRFYEKSILPKYIFPNFDMQEKMEIQPAYKLGLCCEAAVHVNM